MGRGRCNCWGLSLRPAAEGRAVARQVCGGVDMQRSTLGPAASSPVSRYYCALMGHPFEGFYKKDTYMYVSSTPVLTAVVHNLKLVANKETRQVAPYWRLLVVVGGFETVQSALAFGREWVSNKRGWQSKRRHGMQLARDKGLPFYASPNPDAIVTHADRERALEHLEDVGAPEPYVQAYQRMCMMPPQM